VGALPAASLKGKVMTKEEVQKLIRLRGGVPLGTELFEWDEATNTFSTAANNICVDFADLHNAVIRTGPCNLIVAGDKCDILTRCGCRIVAGSSSNIATTYGSIISSKDYSTITTDKDCEITAGRSCVVSTGRCCRIKAGPNSVYKALSKCTYTYADGTIHAIPPLRFSGTRTFIEASGVDSICSGDFLDNSTEWFLQNIESYAKAHYNYSPFQIEEYKLYVKMIDEWQRNVLPLADVRKEE